MFFDFLDLKVFMEICIADKPWGICNYSEDFVLHNLHFFGVRGCTITPYRASIGENWANNLFEDQERAFFLNSWIFVQVGIKHWDALVYLLDFGKICKNMRKYANINACLLIYYLLNLFSFKRTLHTYFVCNKIH